MSTLQRIRAPKPEKKELHSVKKVLAFTAKWEMNYKI